MLLVRSLVSTKPMTAMMAKTPTEMIGAPRPILPPKIQPRMAMKTRMPVIFSALDIGPISLSCFLAKPFSKLVCSRASLSPFLGP